MNITKKKTALLWYFKCTVNIRWSEVNKINKIQSFNSVRWWSVIFLNYRSHNKKKRYKIQKQSI